jgi:heparin/heparan-sulfate lyase
MIRHFFSFIFTILVITISDSYAQRIEVKSFQKDETCRLDFQSARLNQETVHVVTDERLDKKKGLTLKSNTPEAINGEREREDLGFVLKAPQAGHYHIHTYAVTDEEGAALMKKAKSKFESLFMRVQIGDNRATKRVVYVPWDRPRQHTGIFQLSGEEEEIKIWLPRGVRLEYMEIQSYTPPRIPDAAVNYKPSVQPPSGHPRLWVNQESLPLVKENLTKEENRTTWEKLKDEAVVPFVFKFDPDEEMSYNADLEKATETKAFYYLMTGDRKIGREAIDLTINYLANVEFGNILDITRELGRAIYTASLVYDWTYDLLAEEEKNILVKHLMRLAMDMEIGWPPFKTKILNGHGNEAMVNRDFLAMSIAIYDEDPVPYQYVSYAILEELVPMRKFEYQSPRHNQGVGYGAYRFAWEMHAAWLYYRMTGKTVFDDNLKSLSDFWLYMRTPGGEMLRDGDGFGSGRTGQPYYWKSPMVIFLMYTYSKDPIIKGEFLRHGNLNNPVLFLLLNDPDLQAEPSLQSLPLTKDFGPVLGSMVARTGWNIGQQSDDVVAEIKGGGYHFGNHQHADAGSLQIYYRGFQVGDIGLYKFYGTPYDMGFNKRSVAHSMMLAVDPKEEFYRSKANDGGTRFNQRAPVSPQQVQSDPWFNNGKVISTAVGPIANKPFYSYFATDLKGAYTDKIQYYNRSFCFLNMERQDVPAVIILTDNMETRDEEITKYWQINTHHLPEVRHDGFVLHNELGGRVGKTHVTILTPNSQSYTKEVLSDSLTTNVFGMPLEVPETSYPEGKGHRLLVTYKEKSRTNHFITVFQMVDGNKSPLPLTRTTNEMGEIINIGGNTMVFTARHLVEKPFSIAIEKQGATKIVLTGLKEGKWKIMKNGKLAQDLEVERKKNAGYFEAEEGDYHIIPYE